MKNNRHLDAARLLEENTRLRMRLAALEGTKPLRASLPATETPPGLFEAIFETIPDGVLITRADTGTIMNANQGFCKLSGFSKQETIGKTTLDLEIWQRVEDRNRFLADLDRSGSIDDFITQLRRKDGSSISVLISGAHLRQNGERVLLAIIRDVDQFGSLSRELGDSRTRYTDLVELLPAVLFECDVDLRITFMNAAGLDAFGEAMAVDKRILLSQLITPTAGIDLRSWILRAKRARSPARVDVVAHRKDGSSYSALLTVSATQTHTGDAGYLGVVVDTSDQKAVEDRLTKLSRAVEQSPALVLITDRAGHIEYVNPQFTKLTGYAFGEVVGRTPRILKSGVVPEETYRTMWNTILAGREWKTEIVNRKKNGETYWQRSVISPIYDDRGNISHFLEVAEDITREKELESELFQSQKMEAIGHLAGGIAHDFNNMLTVIMGVGQLLTEHLGDSSELHGYTESILSAARKSAALTRQLLAFSRRQLLHPERLDLNVVIKDSEKLLRTIVENNVRIRTSLSSDLGYAMLDQSQLNQIILNLVINAKEAIIGSGTVTITTSRFETDHELILSAGKVAPGSYVMLSISDTGSGMDEETLSHLFEPFFTTKSTGTGLGLATVYGIVRQSNGQIEVESTPGKGTTFRLYFPTTAGDDGSPACDSDSGDVHPVRAGTETILVVEDEQQVRVYVCEVLRSRGYTVVAADSAENAKSLWSEMAEKTDLLLTDVVLPEQDGVHLYRDLSLDRPNLPVLYMSGYTDDSNSILREFVEGRMLLSKPFGAQQLTTAIRRVLDEQNLTASG